MNLYLFNDNDSAAVYGIGTYLKELTKAVDGSAINVHIIHLHSARKKFEIVKTDDAENWYIPEVRYENHTLDAIREIEDYYRNTIYLFRLHIKDTEDLIFHFNFNNCYSLATGLKKAFNCKTVSTVHYTKWHLELHGHLNMLRMMKAKSEKQRSSYEQMMYLAFEYESALFREVDQVIVLSHHMRGILETDYHLDLCKISVIPNGLEDIRPVCENGSKVLQKKWHISEKEYLILFAGRLQPVKGLIFLINAFRILLDKYPDCRLLVAGSGNYDTYFQEARDICTKITFTGLLEKKELYELYQIADVGVVPSLFEPFGYVAVEMMMHELPIVATATSGLNEVVDDCCGLKIPIIEHSDRIEIDSNLLAEKIIYLLEHPDKARKMGQNGRKRYLSEYSSEVFRRNMLNFYTSLYET